MITNHYFISEWKVDNRENAKDKIKGLLEKETKKLRFEILRIENELRANAATLKSMLSMGGVGNPDAALKDFFLAYQFIIEDIKDNYLAIPVDQYIKISEYLKSQPLDKWVLNFYQLGRLPLLDEQGGIGAYIRRLIDEGSVNTKLSLQNLYFDNYRVAFDDQRRMDYFNDLMARLTEGIKDIEIEALAYNNDLITFKLKNLQVVQYEGESFWAVQARLKILDNHSRFVTGLEKVFKKEKKEGEGIIGIRLPTLTGGRYQVVLEVKDLFSLKSVAAGDAITIKK